MIKLQLPPKPAELTSEKEQELVDRFKKNPSDDVWNEDFIRSSLMEMTSNKCAYCEIKITSGIDHFLCKSKYPELVAHWGNLLPCYDYCNTKKGAIDVNNPDTPLINPLVDNPKDFLYIDHGRYYPKNKKGETSIDRLGLNHRTKIADRRSSEINLLDDGLDRIWKDWKTDSKDKSSLVLDLLDQMESCTKENAFSAALSTHLLYESDVYNNIKFSAKDFGLWSSELQDLEDELLEIAMPKTK